LSTSGTLLRGIENFLVLDFEATCNEISKIQPQEIIEFPVLLLRGQGLPEIDRFHRFVKPVYHPQLTDFCTRLTGIIQDMVDFQPTFPDVMKEFESWIDSHFPTEEQKSKFAFVTCGSWDLRYMLPHQASLWNITVPPYCRRWVDVKKEYADFTGQHPTGLISILKNLNLPHDGRLHSGIDDCRNIAKVLRFLVQENVNLRYSE
uniref:Exonuclease domain-containing protein n=1 Tax=Rodentolepis nana TaxID=102285 RepID=A0A0R3TKN8_RODNA